MLKGRRVNRRFELSPAICGKKVLPVTLGSALETRLSAQKPVIMLGF